MYLRCYGAFNACLFDQYRGSGQLARAVCGSKAIRLPNAQLAQLHRQGADIVHMQKVLIPFCALHAGPKPAS